MKKNVRIGQIRRRDTDFVFASARRTQQIKFRFQPPTSRPSNGCYIPTLANLPSNRLNVRVWLLIFVTNSNATVPPHRPKMTFVEFQRRIYCHNQECSQ